MLVLLLSLIYRHKYKMDVGEPRDSVAIDVDSSRSEDEEPNSDDLEAIDADSDLEENINHARVLTKRSRAEALATRSEARDTQERLAEVSGYTDSEDSDTGRAVQVERLAKKKRRVRRRTVSNSSAEDVGSFLTNLPAPVPSPVSHSEPEPESEPESEPEPEATPLEIPVYVENSMSTRVVYQPACAMPNAMEEINVNSTKINIAFSVGMLPLDLASISDRDFEVFQALYLILCAAGNIEVEGDEVTCAYWALGKRNSRKVDSLRGVLEAMVEHYSFSRTIFRIFFHTHQALTNFSNKLLKCQEMLDPRDSRASGPSCINVLKRYIQGVPGLSPSRRKSLVNRIFVQPFQFSRGVVFLAQSQKTIKSGPDAQLSYTVAAVPAILTAAKPDDEGGVELSTNWKTMFSEANVFKQVLAEYPDTLEALNEAITAGDLLHEGEEQYTWTLSNTLRIMEYSAFIPKNSFGDSRDGGFGEKVMHYTEGQRLHLRIQKTTHALLAAGVSMKKYEEALSVVNNYKGTPSTDKWKWEYNQARDLIQAFHAKTLQDTPGFYLEAGVRPGSAWLTELWMGVENGMLSNSLHGAVASMMAVVYGSIRINELEQPNFYGHGQHSAGKSRCAEHCDDLTGDIFETMSWMSEQALFTDSGAGIAFFPEGIGRLTSTKDEDAQGKKNLKGAYGKSRTSTSKRFNVKTGCNDSITTTYLKTSIYVMNDQMNENHIQNQALFSRGITFDFDNIIKNDKSAPAQQLSISESDQRHHAINESYHTEGRLRTSLFNFYDACRCFMNWSVSVDTLGWVFQFLKSIQVGGQVLVTARVTNHVRIFMENYQMHLCCTVLYNKMDVPDIKDSFFEDFGLAAESPLEFYRLLVERSGLEARIKTCQQEDQIMDLVEELKFFDDANRTTDVDDRLDTFEALVLAARLSDAEFENLSHYYLKPGTPRDAPPPGSSPRLTILCE